MLKYGTKKSSLSKSSHFSLEYFFRSNFFSFSEKFSVIYLTTIKRLLGVCFLTKKARLVIRSSLDNLCSSIKSLNSEIGI